MDFKNKVCTKDRPAVPSLKNGVSNFYLHDTLSCFQSFMGVFAPDTLPQNIFRERHEGKMEFLIINSEEISSNRSGHWLSFMRYREDGRCVLEFFDSLAIPHSLLPENVKKMIAISHFDIFKSNLKILQSVASNYCGLYCIARFLSLLNRMRLEKFLSTFEADKVLNDHVVVMYIRDFKLSSNRIVSSEKL